MSAVKWYKKTAVWQAFVFLFAPVITIGEIIVVQQEAHWGWHIVVAALGGLIAALRFFGKDENNNGIIDPLESKDKNKVD